MLLNKYSTIKTFVCFFMLHLVGRLNCYSFLTHTFLLKKLSLNEQRI